MYSIEDVKRDDPQIAELIEAEVARQNSHIELIASENWVSHAVLEAMGSPLTNKYAEGLPRHRFYGGCSVVDSIEDIARDRAKELFGCTWANVQPHSGAQANMAVEFALLQPGDTYMGMNLSEGGHLTHGSPVNFSGIVYNAVPYGVTEDGIIDYDEVERIAKECRPKMIICGASAYPRFIDYKRFREIADSVGAYLMADIAHVSGLIATGLHPSPFPYAHVVTTTTHKTLRGPRGGMILSMAEFAKEHRLNRGVFPGIQGGPLEHVIAAKAVCFREAMQPQFRIYCEQIVKNAKALADGLMARGIDLVSGGTDNHLMLVDLRSTGMTGAEAEEALDAVGITANKNTVPRDPQSAFVTSGLRLGTPAATTRGLKEEDFDRIAEVIASVIKEGDARAEYCRQTVKEIAAKYPLS